MILQTDPTGVEMRYDYDEQGRLWNAIDGSGNEIMREYDGQTDSSASSCTTCSVSLSACSEQSSGANRLARIMYPTFSKELLYDDQGRVKEERDTPNGGEPLFIWECYL